MTAVTRGKHIAKSSRKRQTGAKADTPASRCLPSANKAAGLSGIPTDIDMSIDMGRREAFLRLPPEERRKRVQAFIDAMTPAFAHYSSEDFRADQRREAERDG